MRQEFGGLLAALADACNPTKGDTRTKKHAPWVAALIVLGIAASKALELDLGPGVVEALVLVLVAFAGFMMRHIDA